jgi:hypothetical protein
MPDSLFNANDYRDFVGVQGVNFHFPKIEKRSGDYFIVNIREFDESRFVKNLNEGDTVLQVLSPTHIQVIKVRNR